MTKKKLEINIEEVRKLVEDTNEIDNVTSIDIDYLTVVTACLFLENLGYKIKYNLPTKKKRVK